VSGDRENLQNLVEIAGNVSHFAIATNIRADSALDLNTHPVGVRGEETAQAQVQLDPRGEGDKFAPAPSP
jgi:hypothetical protein